MRAKDAGVYTYDRSIGVGSLDDAITKCDREVLWIAFDTRRINAHNLEYVVHARGQLDDDVAACPRAIMTPRKTLQYRHIYYIYTFR